MSSAIRSAEPHPGRCSVCPPCSGPRAAGGSASGLFPALRPGICYQAVNGGLCEPVLHSLPQGLRPLVIQYILESTLIPYRTLWKTSLASNCLSFQQWGCFFSEKVVLVNINNILYFGWVSIFPLLIPPPVLKSAQNLLDNLWASAFFAEFHLLYLTANPQ